MRAACASGASVCSYSAGGERAHSREACGGTLPSTPPHTARGREEYSLFIKPAEPPPPLPAPVHESSALVLEHRRYVMYSLLQRYPSRFFLLSSLASLSLYIVRSTEMGAGGGGHGTLSFHPGPQPVGIVALIHCG